MGDGEASRGHMAALLGPHGFLLLPGTGLGFCISPVLNYYLHFENNCQQGGDRAGLYTAQLSFSWGQPRHRDVLRWVSREIYL